jgi:hypothetical protein
MSKSRRSRCCICRALFRPDPRGGARQKTCGRAACQQARHAERQGRWRRRNPDYFTTRRLRERLRQAELAAAELSRVQSAAVAGKPLAVRAPPAPDLPRPWRCIPWELIQAELGVLVADVLALVIRALRTHLTVRDGAVGGDSS